MMAVYSVEGMRGQHSIINGDDQKKGYQLGNTAEIYVYRQSWGERFRCGDD